MKVSIPSPLRSYTQQRSAVEAEGATIADVLADLDTRFPGIRFRVIDEQGQLRPHMSIFVRRERCRDLATATAGLDEIVIMQALSGG